MNRIHKIIWSRCRNAFLVVAETARSHARGREGRTESRTCRRAFMPALSGVASAMALVFGLNGTAVAVTKSEPEPGGDVHSVALGAGDDQSLDNYTITNTAYGNALRVSGGGADGGGNSAQMTISGGTFEIAPAGAHAGRPEGDNNPYAAIRLDTVAGTDVYLDDSVQVNVAGELLYGVYVANPDVRVFSKGTQIEAAGKDTVGLFTAGVVSMQGDQIRLDGERASGIKAVGPNAAILTSEAVELDVDGENAVGVSVEDGGAAQLHETSLYVGGGNSTGLVADNDAEVEMSASTIEVEGARGIHARDSSVFLTDGAAIKVDSAGQAYGIDAKDSVISIEGGSLRAEGDSSTRGILSTGNHQKISLSGTSVDALSPLDAWAVVVDGGALDLTDGSKVVAESNDRAIGVYGSAAVLTLNNSTIQSHGAGSAHGVLADSGASLQMSDTDVLAQGAGHTVTAVALTAAQKARILGGTVTASGTSDDGDIVALHATAGSSAVISGTKMFATSDSLDHNTFAAAVMAESGSDITLIDGVEITVRDTVGAAMGISAEHLDTWVNVSGAEVSVTGGEEATGVAAFDGADLSLSASNFTAFADTRAIGVYSEGGVLAIDASEFRVDSGSADPDHGVASGLLVLGANVVISGSGFEVTGGGMASGLQLLDGTFEVSDTRIRVASADGPAAGVVAAWTDTPAVLESVSVEAKGKADTVALLAARSATVVVSNRSELISSHDGIRLEGLDDELSLILMDTAVTAGGNTLYAIVEGEGTQAIRLGTGVVATENNGTLLNVDRDLSMHTGRVELSLVEGARVAGAIHDNASDLSNLTADGGTHVLVSQTDYAGSMQNVRSLTVANAASVSGGTVALPNTVLEDVSVDDAVLGGSWHIAGALRTRNQARVAPGNSIGVITVGQLDWGPGTIYEVEVNAAGESDRVDVTGPVAADISHATLHVVPEGGANDYRLDHDYTILTAAGGIDGSFEETEWIGGGLINVTPVYGLNQIGMTLSVDEDSLARARLTDNQRATADGALSVAGLNAAADAAFLSSDPAASFDLLSGEIHPSTRAGLISSSALLSNAILGRLRDRSASWAAAGAGEAPASTRFPLWASYVHSDQTQKGNDNTAKRKHRINGFSLGGDAELGGGWTIGGAFGYSSSKVKLDSRRSSADIDSYGLAVYVGNSWQHRAGTLNFTAGLGHTWHDVSTRRSVDLGGAQTLKADYDARTLQLFGELGYALPLGERSTVEPYLGLTWLSHRTDGFAEQGGSAALQGERGTEDVTFSTLGLRLTTPIEAGNSVIRVRAGLGWRSAFGDRTPGAKMSFIEGGGSPFRIVGAPIARNSAVFDLGAEVQVGRHTSIGLGYEGQAGNGYADHAGSLYLKTRF